MAINFLLSKIASYPSRTVLFENFFCVVAVLYLVYNLESWVPYLDIIKGIWGEKLFAAAATPPSCHIQSPKEKRARINFASYLLAMLQKIIFAAGGVAFQYQRKKCKVHFKFTWFVRKCGLMFCHFLHEIWTSWMNGMISRIFHCFE